MAYYVSQLRKNGNQIYMVDVPITASTITSPNTFGGSVTFTDFALEGNFTSDNVYYLRFRIHRIPKYFYSGSRTAAEVSMYVNDADNLNLQILLKNGSELGDEETNPPEIIGTCSVPVAKYNESEEYSSYSFVFSPSKTFNRLGFRINRVSYDVINSIPRNWLIDSTIDTSPERRYTSVDGAYVQVSTRGNRIEYSGENADLCTLNNLVTEPSGWLKIGYQCRPGSLIVVNKEPIRVGRSGIYEINNGTIIDSFMIASPGGSDNSKIDAFLLDYAYKG